MQANSKCRFLLKLPQSQNTYSFIQWQKLYEIWNWETQGSNSDGPKLASIRWNEYAKPYNASFPDNKTSYKLRHWMLMRLWKCDSFYILCVWFTNSTVNIKIPFLRICLFDIETWNGVKHFFDRNKEKRLERKRFPQMTKMFSRWIGFYDVRNNEAYNSWVNANYKTFYSQYMLFNRHKVRIQKGSFYLTH